MQSSVNTINNDKNEKLYIKLCTRPTKTQKQIFDALNFKARPYTRKTKVVTLNCKKENYMKLIYSRFN